MPARSVLASLFAPTLALVFTSLGVCGCGNAAPTKAPPITGAPFKKWKDLSVDEKIKVVEKNPIPNKEQMIADIKAGKQ